MKAKITLKAAAILITVLIMTVLGLFTSAASNESTQLTLLWQGTPLFLPHLHKGSAPTLTLKPTHTPTLTPTFDPAHLPDLAPELGGIVYDDPCPWGSPGRVSGLVRNSGMSSAGPFTILFNYTVIPVEGLGASSTVDISSDFKSGPVSYVLIIADYDEDVLEADEMNNRFELFYTPPPYCTPMATFAPSKP